MIASDNHWHLIDKQLTAKMESLSTHILEGGCTDYTKYREIVAELRAYRRIKNMSSEAIEDLSNNDPLRNGQDEQDEVL